MITGRQIREARRLLKWAQWRLARKSGLAANTILRAESEDGVPPVPPESLAKIEAALAAADVELIPENCGGARVRLKRKDGGADAG